MCELLFVALPEPRPFATIAPWVAEIERLGVAGFGWGLARREGGRVRVHRDPGSFRGDPRRLEIEDARSDRWLVHLRRPSKLSTVQLADTQPFTPEDADFAFCHNGSFEEERYRARYAERLLGNADSEVGFQRFFELVRAGADPATALRETHASLGGSANLGYLDGEGRLMTYHGFDHNAVWRFRLGDASIAATGLHSDDSSLFDLVFPDAGERHRVERGETVEIRPVHG